MKKLFVVVALVLMTGSIYAWDSVVNVAITTNNVTGDYADKPLKATTLTISSATAKRYVVKVNLVSDNQGDMLVTLWDSFSAGNSSTNVRNIWTVKMSSDTSNLILDFSPPLEVTRGLAIRKRGTSDNNTGGNIRASVLYK